MLDARWMAALVTAIVLSAAPAASQDMTIRLDLGGQTVEGGPIAWSNQRVILLGRDGFLWEFPPSEAQNFSKVGAGFRSYSQADMRGALMREFGQQFDVSGTGHYLVVHPTGQSDLWAERFEELYRSFMHYFTARGMRPTQPVFPLVAVVFHRQADFARFAAKEGVQVNPGLLGYYSPTTNRVLLFDVTAGQGNNAQWFTNAETIIHEATHQTAFNTGIHSRAAMPPRWLAEGLAMMFEARGVWDSRNFVQQTDRINHDRLENFLAYAASRRKTGSLAEFVSTDRLFSRDPATAYAEAWALSFFLAENEPRKYVQYLQTTAARDPLVTYTSAQSLAEFTGIFGENLGMLEARMLRFIQGL